MNDVSLSSVNFLRHGIHFDCSAGGRGKTGEIHHGSRQQCTVRSVMLIAAQVNSCRVKYHSAIYNSVAFLIIQTK